MSWGSILLWVEQHPGWAAWVQAIGSVIALIFAVWLPAHARSTDRKHAIDGRKSLLIVLLVDIDSAIKTNGPNDPATLNTALSASLKKLDVFLSTETNLNIAREVLKIRQEIKQLITLIDSGYLEALWDSYSAGPSQSIVDAIVRLATDSPWLLPEPVIPVTSRRPISSASEEVR